MVVLLVDAKGVSSRLCDNIAQKIYFAKVGEERIGLLGAEGRSRCKHLNAKFAILCH